MKNVLEVAKLVDAALIELKMALMDMRESKWINAHERIERAQTNLLTANGYKR